MLDTDEPPPRYISWASMLPDPDSPTGPIWLPDPISGTVFYVLNSNVYNDLTSISGMSAVQQVPAYGNQTEYTLFILSQQAADQPMHVTQLYRDGSVVQQWNGTGRGGAAVPFYGWAMFVDSNASMYISDHGRHDDSSPYGRVVKLLANGSEAGEWTMSDGVAYAFTGIAFDASSASGGSCALWAAEREQGLLRLAADGTVQLPAYAAPVDPADNRTAQFSSMALDAGSSSIFLLDSSHSSTTKLWRFSLASHNYTLLNTSAAQLGPDITGLVVDPSFTQIYLTDTNRRTVLMLQSTGELLQIWNASLQGFVEPAGLAFLPPYYERLFVADSGYNGTGAVMWLDCYDMTAPAVVLPQSSPPMYRPLTVALNADDNQLYVSDSNGLVFQYDVRTVPYKQAVFHQPVPAAHNIVSMAAGSRAYMYLLDVYSHRLIIMIDWSLDKLPWPPGQDCLPPSPDSSSSSTAAPALSSSSSSSSSSGAAVQPAARSMWSLRVVMVVIGLALLAVVGAASCVYMKRRRRSRRSGEMDEQLLDEQEEVEQVEEEEEDAEWVNVSVASEAQSDTIAGRDRHATSGLVQLPLDDAVDTEWRHSRAARYDYYVARYEVVESVGDMEEGLSLREAQRGIGAPPSTHIEQSVRTSSVGSVASVSSTSSTSTESSSSSDSSSTHTSPASGFVPSTKTPHHIAPPRVHLAVHAAHHPRCGRPAHPGRGLVWSGVQRSVRWCGVCGEAAQVCVVDGRCMARVAVSPAPAACTFRGALPGCAAHVVHLVPRHSARAARQPALAAPLIHLMLLSTVRRHALCARHVCSAASHAQCGHPASRCQRAQHPGGQRRTVRAGRPGPGDTTQAGATGWQCGWQCSTLDTPRHSLHTRVRLRAIRHHRHHLPTIPHHTTHTPTRCRPPCPCAGRALRRWPVQCTALSRTCGRWVWPRGR